jgi:hypothetical protein
MWEALKNDPSEVLSHRLRVPGGWIVRSVVILKGLPSGANCGIEQTFVSDPNHQWSQADNRPGQK